ncbi:MAG: zinc-dependent metalloprotease, partial [Isosphaeraceae bacterium]
MSRIIGRGWAAVLTVGLLAADLAAQEPRSIDFEGVVAGARRAPRGGSGPFRDFNEVTAGAEKVEGLFTLYKKGEHVYAEFMPHQLNQPLLVPVTIARGIGQTGVPITRADEPVIIFRRVDDRVQLVRRNIHYKATPGSSLDKSVKQNYTDSVLMALPIVSLNMMRGGAVLIDLSDIFMTDFAQLGLGIVDRSRSSWVKVKGFQHNMELEVETTFTGMNRRAAGSQNDPVIDHRGITVVIHYSLMKTPDFGYHPRMADDRVGHFLSANKDFAITDPDSNFVRMINRWRLEKANPRAKLSPPRKQIVWYVEDTVPIEYRPYVEEGIREWNKAFEKIGFKDAIAVRWEEAGRDDFDPEDTNYCTFRWVTGEIGGAMSCMRANPLTGELIDGDVVFDAGFIRAWKLSYALLVGSTTAAGGQEPVASPLAVGEVISPILASKMGYGDPTAGNLLGVDALHRNPNRMVAEVVPADQNFVAWELAKTAARGGQGSCQFQSGIQRDFALAAIAMADMNPFDQTPAPTTPPTTPATPPTAPTTPPTTPSVPPTLDGKGKTAKPEPPKKPEPRKPQPKDELPEEFVGQAIKHIVMHEVGHSLGLRHNFKASTMLKADQLHDTSITHVKGLVGSVMDYSPINIAPKGKKQGDYYSVTLGPYDYWAIEYAYRPADGDEASELKKIAARAPEQDLIYGTDEDVILNDDPYTNRFDLGS